MAGQGSAMIGLSWTDVSVLGSQLFGQALMDSCVMASFFYQVMNMNLGNIALFSTNNL